MAFDEVLAERVRDLVADREVDEKRMFGGLCFLVSGNMCFGIVGSDLMVRVGSDGYEDALSQPHAREMDFTGRVSKSMVFVGEKGTRDDAELAAWLDRGLELASSLPPK